MDTLKTWLKAKRGRVNDLAKALDVTPGAISKWPKVPSDQLFKVSEFTGIPKYQLRPDLVTMTGKAA